MAPRNNNNDMDNKAKTGCCGSFDAVNTKHIR